MPTEAGPHRWVARLLQTSDALFPTGAYAHSLGLEESVRLGVVEDETSLAAFLRDQILPSLERFELPLLRKAHEAAESGEIDALLQLNAELDAWKPARELREASLGTGTRRLAMLMKCSPPPVLVRFATACGGAAHQLIVCGAQGVGMPVDAVLAAYLYQSLAGYCGAALKLIRIGQEGCQRVLTAALAQTDAIVDSAMQADPATAVGWFNPLLEIAAMRHERAFERLFIS